MDPNFITGGFGEFGGADDEPFLIQRIDSRDIIYSPPKRKYKLVGKYVMGDQLGEGSYGKVKECLDTVTLQRRAIKIMKRKKLRKIPHGEQNVEREIRLLRGLCHRNVISLLDVYQSEEKAKIYMVMEYCVTGLQDMLNKATGKKFPIWQAHKYFVQLVDGLEYLHSRGVIHKDIKPGNLLLTTDSTLKISDFGVAEQVSILAGNDDITTSQGSPLFQPPEVAGGAKVFPGFKVDVWSAGCTLYNLTTGEYPFEGENVFRLYENICEMPVTIPEELDPVLVSLLEKMLLKDPRKRMSLYKVKNHDWCQKKHPRGLDEVPVGGEDDRHTMTVVPYLQSHHYYGEEFQSDEYISEHQLNEVWHGTEMTLRLHIAKM
ncbi:serine/threonine-protein kinase stk11-like isoform X2 [Oratosquilla oratoria]|uniref:serine/threonine-protein kinase stk11-like isoform X2 n=1 Tax=Oratosquilla oratoria TaxID=337810 RepID=UPI003F76C3B1